MIEARKEARRGPRAVNLIGALTRTKEALETKAKGKGKSETRYYYDCGEQGCIGVNCPYKWTSSIDEDEDQGSLWECEVSLMKKRQKSSRAWRHLMTRESGAGPEGTGPPDGQSKWTQDRHSTTLLRMTRKSKRLED